MTDNVLTQRRGAVLEVTLNRPKANAIDMATSRRLGEIFTEFRDDPELRVAILTAQGEKFFCPGWDLKAAAEGEAADADYGVGGFGGLQELRGLNKPVIAAVNGLAMAGGLEMVMACDLVFAAESAQMGDAHSNFGVFPGAGGAAILPRRVGLNRAKYLLFSGENVSAREMMEWGLVNKVVADAQLRETVQAFADKLSDKSPAVLRRMKTVANRSLNVDEPAALAEEMLNLRAHMRSWDMREGLTAFVEKRKPQFRGY